MSAECSYERPAEDHECQVVNIHHPFLPGFKGARCCAQAFERGVKLIGATARYVTADLDEEPIIEQLALQISASLSSILPVVNSANVRFATLHSSGSE